jgi:hypothetical protein
MRLRNYVSRLLRLFPRHFGPVLLQTFIQWIAYVHFFTRRRVRRDRRRVPPSCASGKKKYVSVRSNGKSGTGEQ